MIRCENVSAGYGKEAKIEGITWEAAAGKMTVLVGPNGCGKSTLLKTLVGQTKRNAGEVFLEGTPIANLSSREIARKIAYLPQNRSDANISVSRMVLHGRFPYIVYPRHYTAQDEKKVEDALARMGIAGLKHKPVSELSGGEKQKVYLAMALVQDASVLLLDEPMTYLDLSCQLELMRMLCMLKENGKTVILVSHDLNHALQYADEILVMEAGRIIRKGTPEEIRQLKILEQVFHLRIHSLTDEHGRRHYCFSAEG